jgi:hypothetical protein
MTIPTIRSSNLTGNTVRPQQTAVPMAMRSFDAYDSDAERIVTVELRIWKGTASAGAWDATRARKATWWTTMTVSGRTFGRSFGGRDPERAAWADFKEAVSDWEKATR